MRVVLGLGNVGREYEGTRHNVGFLVADVLASRAGGRFQDFGGPERVAFVAEVSVAGEPVALVKPRTLMNRSGRAAAAACRRYGCAIPDLLVVYDDADLAFGRVRVRPGGGAGGHNGIRSLMDVLGSPDFGRVKLGVRGAGRDEVDLADYVLRSFEPDERPEVPAMVALGADAVEAVLSRGIEPAMNLFNGKS